MLFSLGEHALIPGATAGVVTPRQLGFLDSSQALGIPIAVDSAPRFINVRVLQISVWGPDNNSVNDTAGVFLSIVQATANQSGGDGALFRDYGTDGAFRAALNVRPNFALRSQWFSTESNTEGNQPIFAVGTIPISEPTQAGQIIIRVVLEFR